LLHSFTKQYSLFGGSGAFSTTGSGIASRVVVTAAASRAVRHDGHPLSTRGPQVQEFPTAVNCTTHVQSNTVVVARSIHSFKLDRAAAATDDGHLSFPSALIPIAALHTVERGPARDQRARASPRGIFTSARKTTTWNIREGGIASPPLNAS